MPRVRPPLPHVPTGLVPRAAMGAGVGASILPFGALRFTRRPRVLRDPIRRPTRPATATATWSHGWCLNSPTSP